VRDIAEPISVAPLSVLGPFQMLLLACFTGMGWAMQERLEALAQGGTS
jgi:hypothetical protein